MSQVPAKKSIRRIPSSANPAMIVLIVPLAASCLFGLPLSAHARQVLVQQLRVELAAASIERTRRPADVEKAEPTGDDPPARVAPHGPRHDSPAEAAAVCAEPGNSLLSPEALSLWHERHGSFPGLVASRPVDSRGPPAVRP
jgi:hypothetical protein